MTTKLNEATKPEIGEIAPKCGPEYLCFRAEQVKFAKEPNDEYWWFGQWWLVDMEVAGFVPGHLYRRRKPQQDATAEVEELAKIILMYQIYSKANGCHGQHLDGCQECMLFLRAERAIGNKVYAPAS